MVARDAAAVRRDAAAMAQKMSQVATAIASGDAEGQEAAAFLEWARNGGFESFGYAYYRVVSGQSKLVRDIPSRIGVLSDAAHPVYDTCLAGIPEDFDTLAARINALSVVKADVQSTLHRDQQLDFIGVRDVGAEAFSSANTASSVCFQCGDVDAVAQLPFARGRIKQVLTLAGVRQEGFRAEKFLEILESLPRTEALEAEPEWLANVCSNVVCALQAAARNGVCAPRRVWSAFERTGLYAARALQRHVWRTGCRPACAACPGRPTCVRRPCCPMARWRVST